jgi:hypothetical protein
VPNSWPSGASPRFSAPIKLIVTSEARQFMPMTTPDDWSQNGCASRASSSRGRNGGRWLARDGAERDMRSASHCGTRPSGRDGHRVLFRWAIMPSILETRAGLANRGCPDVRWKTPITGHAFSWTCGFTTEITPHSLLSFGT